MLALTLEARIHQGKPGFLSNIPKNSWHFSLPGYGVPLKLTTLVQPWREVAVCATPSVATALDPLSQESPPPNLVATTA